MRDQWVMTVSAITSYEYGHTNNSVTYSMCLFNTFEIILIGVYNIKTVFSVQKFQL
jgi:hypothetical protein